MKHHTPTEKLNFVIQSYAAGANLSKIAKSAIVSRPTFYSWRRQFDERAKFIFVPGSLLERSAELEKKFEDTRKRLLGQVWKLRDALRREDIPIPPPGKEFETEYDESIDFDEAD
jgi:transposase-like protein